jgi:hypothetical protein
MTAALRHSPDVHVAEAKLREAEAELRRTRLALLQKVSEVHTTVDANRAAVAQAEAKLARANQLTKAGAMSSEDRHAAEAQLAAAKAMLAQSEATINALTGALPGPMAGLVRAPGDGGLGGGMPGPAGMPMGGVGMIGGFGGMIGFPVGGGALGLGGGMGGFAAADEVQGRMPRGKLARTVRAALDAPIQIKEVNNAPLGEVIKSFQSPGVPFLVHLGPKKDEPVNLSLKGEIALGAAFQALQDVVPGLQCYVREYGILVTLDEAAPADGIALIDFWQNQPEADKTKARAKE